MKKIILLLGVAAGLSACTSEAVQKREDAEADYHTRHYSAYQTRNCIAAHLSEMAAADHVQKWDAELYNSVARQCDKLFLDAATEASGPESFTPKQLNCWTKSCEDATRRAVKQFCAGSSAE